MARAAVARLMKRAQLRAALPERKAAPTAAPTKGRRRRDVSRSSMLYVFAYRYAVILSEAKNLHSQTGAFLGPRSFAALRMTVPCNEMVAFFSCTLSPEHNQQNDHNAEGHCSGVTLQIAALGRELEREAGQLRHEADQPD